MTESTKFEPKLALALAKVQAALKNAAKDAVNPHFKSTYADLTSIWDACREPLAANDLSIAQVIRDNHLVTILMHKDGEMIESYCPLINNKGDMQGLGSAITYARRYGLAAMVGVTAEDDDGNAASGKENNVAKTLGFSKGNNPTGPANTPNPSSLRQPSFKK